MDGSGSSARTIAQGAGSCWEIARASEQYHGPDELHEGVAARGILP